MRQLSLVGALVVMAACSSSGPDVSGTPVAAAQTNTATSQTAAAAADEPPPPSKHVNYSPYPSKNFPDRVYWGDTHLHTSYSTDAGMTGTVLGPEEAYRFARGEAVKSNHGAPVQLQRAYDFLVVSDHAENLGLAPLIAESNPELLKSEWGKKVHDLVKAGKGMEAYNVWGAAMLARQDPLKAQGQTVARPVWQRITAAAEKYNEPGRFTAIIGFEWSAGPNGNNLHRNVLFRDGKDKADQIIPLSYYDTADPEQLWTWMADYEDKTGGRALAIPHNGNLSNGLMFDDVTLTTKKPLDRSYAERRQRWEPLYETTQMKGDGETHPSLSPSDEFANFERWDKGSFGPELKTPAMLPREYTREALKRGLAYEQQLGVNPFKFGLIGSTDSHTGLSTAQENNFFGKVAFLEPSADPIRFDEVMIGRFPAGRDRKNQHLARETSVSGLAAIWSRANTREALWDAMARKEVYATTGTRILVRVFGGYDFVPADLEVSDFAENGYAKGVPMGGDLKVAPAGKVPVFLVRALRDADGANLDRIQMIKGWLDAEGRTHEQIYDLAWSGHRKPGRDGILPPVGNTVNVTEASYTNAIGAPYLTAYWKDPKFDARERAFYYVRVTEIPTPRWTTYDAKFFGVPLPTDVPATIQERAYTTPIWYTPR
jgi:hypothetical protein